MRVSPVAPIRLRDEPDKAKHLQNKANKKVLDKGDKPKARSKQKSDSK